MWLLLHVSESNVTYSAHNFSVQLTRGEHGFKTSKQKQKQEFFRLGFSGIDRPSSSVIIIIRSLTAVHALFSIDRAVPSASQRRDLCFISHQNHLQKKARIITSTSSRCVRYNDREEMRAIPQYVSIVEARSISSVSHVHEMGTSSHVSSWGEMTSVTFRPPTVDCFMVLLSNPVYTTFRSMG